MSDLRGRTLSGIAWATIGKIISRIGQFIIGVVLARLLSPTEFGIMGLAAVFIGFARLFSDFGFASALINTDELTDEHIQSTFWLNIVVGIGLCGVFVAAAPLVAEFYAQPILTDITRLLGLSFLLSAVGVVPLALLKRDMNFRAITFADSGRTLVAGVAAIGLALNGFGVWSLVAQALSGQFLYNVLIYRFSEFELKRIFDLDALKELFGFSANLFGFNFINYWARNADNLLIGKLLGADPLGVYTRAYSLMMLPVSQITSVIGNVMFPALSSIKDDTQRVKRIYLRANRVITFIAFPIMLGLWAVSEPFILAVYGPKWVEVTPILEILCFVGAIQVVCNPVGWIYTSQGRTDWMFRWGLVASATLIVAIAIGAALRSIESIALAYLGANILLLYPCLLFPGKLIEMSVLGFARAIFGNILATATMAALAWSTGLVLPSSWSIWWQLAAQVAVGATVYCMIALGFRMEAYIDVRDIVRRRFGLE